MDEQLKILRGKKIAVLGVGIEGLSTGRFLKKYGVEVTFFDEKTLSESVLREAESLGRVVWGKDAFSKLQGFDLIFRSPGIKKTEKYITDAVEKGAVLTSHIKLFFDLCPAPIVGVTGTKGKGTTSTLIYEMLKASGRDAYLGGNIGLPPLEFVDTVKEQSIVVLELSSFQLADLTKSPHIAVMLMVVPEHLNYHSDMADYVDAKRNMLRFQTAEDFAVINRDYIASNESDVYTDGKVFYVTRERSSTEQGSFIKDGAIWMSLQGTEWKIIDTEKIALPGKHNWENAAAASVAATLAGATKAEIVHVLQHFTGLEHRLELVKEVNGVKYYDDSFSTTPETAIAAIESFDAPKILILGGSSKGSDFTELGRVIATSGSIKAVIGIGEEWARIKHSIEQGGEGKELSVLFIEGAQDMHTVVQAASKLAREGDVVLLSPACASFGMFKNYKERGNKFKEEVEKL